MGRASPARDEAELLAEIERRRAAATVLVRALPDGERTPHNDAGVRGGFVGLDGGTTRAEMTLAVLEGVAYALRDAQQALATPARARARPTLIGGGARSPLWAQ